MTPTARHRRTRLHEAGHVVLGRVVGLEPRGVVVFGDEGHTTHALPTDRQVDRMTRDDWRTFQESMIVADLAGEAALEAFGDPAPGDGAEADRDRALRMARSIDPASPQATIARLRGRAGALAREHRAAIERLAATLAANADRLAGSEVDVAVRAALGGWPTPRFDAASEAEVTTRKRAIFERSLAALGSGGQPFAVRLDHWRRADDAARSGRLAGRPVERRAGLGWTPDQRREAQAAYLRGGTSEALAHVAEFRGRH